MPQTAQINIKLTDNTHSNQNAATGIYGMMGTFPMGPTNEVSEVYKNFDKFKAVFGDLSTDFPDVLQAKIALDMGCALRVVNVKNTGNSGATKATQVGKFTAPEEGEEEPEELFAFTPKFYGKAYNNLVIAVVPAASGMGNAFDLTIQLTNDNSDVIASELYKNLKITSKDDKEFLKDVERNSLLVDVVYKTLTLTGDIVPEENTVTFSGGTEGTTTSENFINALPAWDNATDIWGISAPNKSLSEEDDVTFYNNLLAYVGRRKEVRGMIWVGISSLANTLIEDRGSIDSEWVDFFGGDIVINSPYNSGSKEISISPMGAVLGIHGNSDTIAYPWYSAAGTNRGKINIANKVTYNFGTPAKFDDLDKLAQHQINMIVEGETGVYLSGNFTGQIKQTMQSYTSVMKLYTYIKRTLILNLKDFIEEPLDLILVRQIYNRVLPIMNDLNSTSKRALQQPRGWAWLGDQNCSIVQDMTVNDPIDFQMGKYKAILQIQPVNSLQVMDIEVALTDAGVELAIA